MKQSSLEANKRANESGLKLSHKKQILEAFGNDYLTAKELSEATGLSYHAVSRRTGELEREGKILVIQHLPVCRYAKRSLNLSSLSNATYTKKQFKAWQKKASKFEAFMDQELITKIQSL